MLGAFVIVLREVIEGGLIVGIVLAATRGVPQRGAWVAGGVAAGIAGAAVVGLFAGAIGGLFDGYGQEIFNAAVLLVAILMLATHNAWMAKHGRELAATVRGVGQAVSEGSRPLFALAMVCAMAVMREGAEVVLFLYGVVLSGSSGSALLAGGLLGVVGGAAITGLSYFGLLAIPQRLIFAVTGWMIILLAAGMAAQAVAYLNAADVLTVLNRPVWDTSWLLKQSSIPGLVLHTLIGYVEKPTGMQLIAYVATIAGMVTLMRIAATPARKPVATAA